MKRIFISLAVAATALSAGATDFQGNMKNDVSGQKSSEDAVISVEENADGTSKVTIHNYSFEYYGQKNYVGTIVLDGVKTTKVGAEKTSVTLLESAQKVEITEGDNDAYSWQGPSYTALCGGTVPVVFKGEVHSGKLTAALDIDVYQAIRRRIKATFGEENNRYTVGQMLGADFETWHKSTYEQGTIFSKKEYSSDEPDGWHSFMSATGSLSNAVRSNTHTYIDSDVRPGSTGKNSVKVVSGIVLGFQPANGTLTNGRLYAGDMSATGTGNNSTSDPTKGDVDSNNDPFFTAFNSRPDSISVWVKYKQGTLSEENKTKYPYATVSAIINDGTKYQDPEDKTYTNIVAKAKNAEIAENDFQWQRVSIPFDYASYEANGVNPGAILVTLSTNAQPGVASTDSNNPDQLFIDDLELVYNAQLNSVKIGGKAVEGFDKGNYYYEGLSFDGTLTEDDVEFESNAQGAYTNMYITRSESEKGYATVTITVTSGDLKTVNAYTFKVKEVLPEPQVTYTDKLALTLNGIEMDPSEASIITTQHEDGSYDLMLQQFSFSGLLIGDVTITNVPTTVVDGWTVYTADQDAVITNGDAIAEALGGKVHVSLVGQSKDGKLYAEIKLPVSYGDTSIDVFAVFGDRPTNAINSVLGSDDKVEGVYNASGMKLQKMEKGLNIVRLASGKTVKVVKK